MQYASVTMIIFLLLLATLSRSEIPIPMGAGERPLTLLPSCLSRLLGVTAAEEPRSVKQNGREAFDRMGNEHEEEFGG